jgi:signal transduction histidine kinase
MAKDDAEAASRAKAQFLAAISHEMRTPLTGILGALDLIAATDLSEQQRRYVRTANRSGHALLSVISDVLDISRLEHGKVDLDIDNVDLEQIVEDVVEIIGHLARDRGNTISVHLDERLPGTHLIGDPARIRQVLLNFATNAVKFTYGGRVEISVVLGRSEDRVEVSRSPFATPDPAFRRRPGEAVPELLPAEQREQRYGRRQRPRPCHIEASRGSHVVARSASRPRWERVAASGSGCRSDP